MAQLYYCQKFCNSIRVGAVELVFLKATFINKKLFLGENEFTEVLKEVKNTEVFRAIIQHFDRLGVGTCHCF